MLFCFVSKPDDLPFKHCNLTFFAFSLCRFFVLAFWLPSCLQWQCCCLWRIAKSKNIPKSRLTPQLLRRYIYWMTSASPMKCCISLRHFWLLRAVHQDNPPTNNEVDGWHNAFARTVQITHPDLPQLGVVHKGCLHIIPVFLSALPLSACGLPPARLWTSTSSVAHYSMVWQCNTDAVISGSM